MEKQILLILVIFLWLSIITFGGHKNSGDKNIQKSSSISDSAVSTSNILYTNADGDLGIDPLVNYKLTPGLIMPYLSNTIPTGWVECDGRQLSKTEYSALYTIIGNSYGESGDNFLVPDLRGKVIMGSGTNLNNNGNQGGSTTYSIGDTGGEYTHTLTTNEMPSHRHDGDITRWSLDDSNHSECLQASGYCNSSGHFPGHGGIGTAGHGGILTTYTGGSAAHENRPPYFVAQYIIFTGKN